MFLRNSYLFVFSMFACLPLLGAAAPASPYQFFESYDGSLYSLILIKALGQAEEVRLLNLPSDQVIAAFSRNQPFIKQGLVESILNARIQYNTAIEVILSEQKFYMQERDRLTRKINILSRFYNEHRFNPGYAGRGFGQWVQEVDETLSLQQCRQSEIIDRCNGEIQGICKRYNNRVQELYARAHGNKSKKMFIQKIERRY